jgi:hypothetical protein
MQYTDIQQQFLDLLKKYPVPDPETIVDYVGTQGEGVLEEPEKLATALRDTDIVATRRRQILKHWFADKGIEVPDKILQKVTVAQPDSQSEDEDNERKLSHQEKFAVNEDTGVIKTASGSEKSLTWDEAVKASERIKKELLEKNKNSGPLYFYDDTTNTIRMAKDGERGGTMENAKELKLLHDKDAELKAKADRDNKVTPESPFHIDENGQWQVVPGARLSTVEMMTWQSIQKAAAAGQPVDMFTELSNSAEKLKTLKDLFGGGQTIPAYLASPEAFAAAVKAAVGTENTETKALNAKIDQMIKDQHDMELRRRDDENKALQNQINSANNKINDLEEKLDNNRNTTGKTAYDLLDKIGNKIPDAKEVKDTIQMVIQNPPRIGGSGAGSATNTLAEAASKLENVGARQKAENAWFNLQ